MLSTFYTCPFYIPFHVFILCQVLKFKNSCCVFRWLSPWIISSAHSHPWRTVDHFLVCLVMYHSEHFFSGLAVSLKILGRLDDWYYCLGTALYLTLRGSPGVFFDMNISRSAGGVKNKSKSKNSHDIGAKNTILRRRFLFLLLIGYLVLTYCWWHFSSLIFH